MFVKLGNAASVLLTVPTLEYFNIGNKNEFIPLTPITNNR